MKIIMYRKKNSRGGKMKKRQRKKQVQKRIIAVGAFMLILFVVVLAGIFLKKKYDEKMDEKMRIAQEEERKLQEEKERKAKLQERLNIKIDFDIHSKAAIVKDLQNQKILGALNPEKQIYPASMTKIMTAVVAIEKLKNLDERITIPTSEVQSLYERGASVAGFWPGESITVKDLLYGLMLPSGAECCVALAGAASGNEDVFIKEMNDKAKELGMVNTNFANTTGLHDENHYSTVQDMMILLEYALQHETFYQVFTARSYTTAPTLGNQEGIRFESTVYEKIDRVNITDGEFLGGKTGYTQAAGLCLASLAEVEGQKYILVTAGAEGNHNTEPFHVMDAENIYKIGRAHV